MAWVLGSNPSGLTAQDRELIEVGPEAQIRHRDTNRASGIGKRSLLHRIVGVAQPEAFFVLSLFWGREQKVCRLSCPRKRRGTSMHLTDFLTHAMRAIFRKIAVRQLRSRIDLLAVKEAVPRHPRTQLI